MKEEIQNWLTEMMRVSGMLACGIRAADRKTFIRTHSPQFTSVALEQACRCVGDTFQVLHSNRFPSQLVRWVYENYYVYGFLRKDGHSLTVLTRRAEPRLTNTDLESMVAEFHSLPI